MIVWTYLYCIVYSHDFIFGIREYTGISITSFLPDSIGCPCSVHLFLRPGCTIYKMPILKKRQLWSINMIVYKSCYTTIRVKAMNEYISYVNYIYMCIYICVCVYIYISYRLQRKLPVSDSGMHHGTCVTHVPWCMSGSLTRGGRENVPGIPNACTTCNFAYVARAPCAPLPRGYHCYLSGFINHAWWAARNHKWSHVKCFYQPMMMRRRRRSYLFLCIWLPEIVSGRIE